ncbi:NUDIX domain-containing protein [Mycobacterium sp. C31M]
MSPTGEPSDGYYARLARVRQGAGALITHADGRVLMVDTTYRDYLEIPGGAVEAGETAPLACIRECREELGHALGIGRLLVVDHHNDGGELGDSVMFVYDGGVLDVDEPGLRAPDHEVRALLFVDPAELGSVTIPRLADRIRWALAARADGTVREAVSGHTR